MMGRTILVVDDDAAIRRVLTTNLELEGYVVQQARDGAHALEMVEAISPDLIVLDVTMPVMDGFEVVEQLRSKPETAGLPVILLTALASTEDIWAGWNKGVDFYMTKPFDINELIRFIEYIFQEVGKPKPL